MGKVKKILFALMFVLMFMLLYKVNAASVVIAANKSSVQPGESVTFTVTGTGAASYQVKVSVTGAGVSQTINLSAYTDDLSNGNKSASATVTPTSEGTIVASVTSGNATVAGGTGAQAITGASKSVTVKKVVQTPPSTNTGDYNPGTSTSGTTGSTSSSSSQTNKKTNNQSSSNKTSTTANEQEEQEEKTSETPEETPAREIALYSLIVKGEKEDGTIVDLDLDKEFESSNHEYIVNVGDDIKRIQLETEAYEYNDFIEITGIDQDLVPGENIISIKIKANDSEVEYILKVMKPEKIEENQATVEEKASFLQNISNFFDQNITFKMKYFILMIVLIVIVESIIVSLITRKLVKRKKIKLKHMKLDD